MKPRIPTAVLLFLSSYAPLGLIVVIQNCDWAERSLVHKQICGAICIVSLIAAILPFALLQRLKGGTVHTITRLSNRTGDLVNYALPYLVAFVALKFDDSLSLLSFGIFMALFCALTIRSQALWINPLLVLAGYYLYEAEFLAEEKSLKSAMLISPKRLEVGFRCRIIGLTEFQFYATEPDIDGQSGKGQGNGNDKPIAAD